MKIFHAIKAMSGYSSWIPNRVIVDNMEEADIVFFEGGTDVFAGRYGEVSHPYAEYPDHKRDEKEIKLYHQAVSLGKPIIGICRGSQLACVMNHGRLVQDQPNPRGVHDIITYDGHVIPMTSTHHQAQFPFNLVEGLDYKLLAWTEGMLNYHEDGNRNEMNPPVEAEIVYYPKTRTLAIQGHPEYVSREDKSFSSMFKWLDEKVNLLLTNKL